MPGRTGPQIYAGLAGLFIIDDANNDVLSLPKTYGVDDIALIVQDRRFDVAGQLAYGGTRMRETFGQLGDTILVNGTYAPATDGGFLERPVEGTHLVLAPGERAEIVVDMSASERPVTLMSDAVPDAGGCSISCAVSASVKGTNIRSSRSSNCAPRLSAAPNDALPKHRRALIRLCQILTISATPSSLNVRVDLHECLAHARARTTRERKS